MEVYKAEAVYEVLCYAVQIPPFEYQGTYSLSSWKYWLPREPKDLSFSKDF